MPVEPMLVIPNRIDGESLEALEAALGGVNKVAWLVEDGLRPAPAIMESLRARRSDGVLFSMRRTSSEKLAEQVREKLEAGRHVALLSGRPEQVAAGLADVPPVLLEYLLRDYSLPVLPVYVGMYRVKEAPLVVTQEPYERMYVRMLPALTSASASGVTAAWLGAAAEQVGHLADGVGESLALNLLQSLIRHPQAAVIDGVDDSRMSYRQLLMHAAPLASRLRKHTISRRLGIILPPGKFAIVANVACILAGITPVNIDYNYGAAAFDQLARQAELTRFITEHRFIRMQQGFPWPRQRDILFIDDAIASSGLQMLSLWRLIGRWLTPRHVAGWLRTPQRREHDEALAVFTSAEEGQTVRGVSLSHRAVLMGAALSYSRFGMGAGQRVLSCMPFSHREGLLMGMVYPLLLGQDIITYPMPGAAKRLCRLAHDYGPAMAVFTPSQAAGVLGHAQEGDLTSIRYLQVAGALSAQQAQFAFSKYGIYLCRSYQPLELSMPLACNIAPISPQEDAPAYVLPSSAPGTAGLPMPGVALRITDIDDASAVLPLNAQGLIWMRSACVCSGYVGSEQRVSPERWVCTGDVGCLREDGLLVLGGSRSRFSKVNGEVISHAVVESLLYPLLRLEAKGAPRIAVVGISEAPGGEEMLVLLSTAHRVVGPHDVITIRYALKNAHHSSNYAPQRIVALRAIPTLPGGRVDYAFCRTLARHALGIKS